MINSEQKLSRLAVICKNVVLSRGIAEIAEPTFGYVLRCSAPVQLLNEAQRLAPDPIVVIVASELIGTPRVLSEARTLLPDARIVLAFGDGTPEHVEAALAGGVHGYLTRDVSPEDMLSSLLLIERDQTVFPASGISALALAIEKRAKEPAQLGTTLGGKQLSVRETQVLQLLASGSSNKAIAKQLELAESTVRIHVRSIMRKIDVKNRTQAALWAVASADARSREADGRDRERDQVGQSATALFPRNDPTRLEAVPNRGNARLRLLRH